MTSKTAGSRPASARALWPAARETDKPIAAICHAAQLLAAAGVLKGRRCSCYPAVGSEVVAAGGTYADIPIDKACVDGN